MVSHWGATKAEYNAAMPNDDQADFIVGTRAININKPLTETWAWVNQLGADRSGFFSYYFIEKAMGYYTRKQDIIKADFPEFKIGDLIRGSIHPEQSIFIYEFAITDVKSQQYFTADKWGTFLLKPIGENTTRLIIRTHGKNRGGTIADGVDYVAFALHFIMERATMNGFKQRIEFGEGTEFSNIKDLLWFAFIVVSGLLIGLLIFLLKGMRAIMTPLILSSLWLITLFILPPYPIFSGVYAAILLFSNWYTIAKGKTKKLKISSF